MGYLSTDKKKITTKTFAEMKAAGEKVTMLTAYDFTTACLCGMRYAIRQLSDQQGRGTPQCVPHDEGDGRGCPETRRWCGDC